MAYTRITNTRNGAAAIRYAFEESSHKKGMDRVLMASGINLDPRFAMQQMRDTWKAHGKDDGETVQMYRIIQSFGLDELDPNNPDDIAKANEIGQTLASELYPDKQALIVTQADGEGGKLHNHVLVNSVSFTDGKSLRGYRKEHDAVAELTDDILVRRGMKPLDTENTRNKRTSQEKRLAEQGKYVWKDDLRWRIAEGLNNVNVTSQDAFIEHMRDSYGVTVDYRGNKYITYSFEDTNGTPRKSRSNKLGTDYERDSVANRFDKNVVLQQVAKHRQLKEQAQQTEPSVFVFDIDAELEAIRPARPKKASNRGRKPQETELMKEVRLEREAQQQARKVDMEHADALVENAHLDARRRAEQEIEQRKVQEAQERIRAQEQAEREERVRQLEEQRKRALQRIQRATTPRHTVTIEFIDRFIESAKELDGKTHRRISGKIEPYNDFDIYNHTKFKIAAEKKRERTSTVEQIAEQDMESAGPGR